MTADFPAGFLVRPPEMDDLEAVHKLIEACDIADDGKPDITLDELRTEWQGPNFDMENDAWMVSAPGGRVVGYADMGQREHTRVYALVRVLPEYVDRGIMEPLFYLSEQWARQQIPRAKPEARITLNHFASSRNQKVQRLFEQLGMKEIRRHWRMEIELDEAPPEPHWPEQVFVRTLVPGRDERAVFDTDDEAFQDPRITGVTYPVTSKSGNTGRSNARTLIPHCGSWRLKASRWPGSLCAPTSWIAAG